MKKINTKKIILISISIILALLILTKLITIIFNPIIYEYSNINGAWGFNYSGYVVLNNGQVCGFDVPEYEYEKMILPFFPEAIAKQILIKRNITEKYGKISHRTLNNYKIATKIIPFKTEEGFQSVYVTDVGDFSEYYLSLFPPKQKQIYYTDFNHYIKITNPLLNEVIDNLSSEIYDCIDNAKD